MAWLIGDEADLETVEAYWPTVAEVDTDTLAALLTSAQVQCAAFAPALAVDAEVPDNYQHAQVLQARALFRAALTGSGDLLGADGLGVTVFPMDWTVKALLRPRKGCPVIA